MTALTLAQAKEVARSIHAIRRDWDRPGIEDALGRARHLSDASTLAVAAHRAASDPANRTPAVIALDGPHWRDATRTPHFPGPESHERCSTCSEREDRCRALWSKDHPFVPDLRPATGIADEHVDQLRTLRNETTAALCKHGVPPANCNDHRPKPSPIEEPA